MAGPADDLVIAFGADGSKDFSLVGGKVARLVESGERDFATPAGFAITTAAFLAFMDSVDDGALPARIADFEADPQADAKPFETEIRAAITDAPMTRDLVIAISDAYQALCLKQRHVDCPVAVRSSATGEDAKDASFAGQYDSYLGISGMDALVDAVKRGWASLFTERALLYRRRAGLAYRETPMALGVMTLIDARAAGVGFSVHPVRGTSDRMVVESTFGFGEALVQGLVTPDHAEIDKSSLRILEHTIGDKGTVSVLDYHQGAVVERPMPEGFRQAPSLTDEELQAVGALLRSTEEHAGHAVDIEWVIPHGWQPGMDVSLVQVRPVTVAGKTPQPAEVDNYTEKPAYNPGAFAAKQRVRRKRGR